MTKSSENWQIEFFANNDNSGHEWQVIHYPARIHEEKSENATERNQNRRKVVLTNGVTLYGRFARKYI